MKLERLHEYILPVVATGVGMALAVYCGRLTGFGQMGTTVFIIALCTALGLLLTLRQNIWILIPIAWTLPGQIPVLPLPFSVRDLVVMVVFCSFLALKALKIVRLKPKIELIDLCSLLMLLYLVTVFLRNPVGVNALGSNKVGGRPYFDVFIGILASWVLVRCALPTWGARSLPFLMNVSQVFEMGLNMIATRIPSLAPILADFYSGVDPASFEGDNVWRGPVQETSGRQAYLAGIGYSASLLACSFWRPLTLISPIYWVRFLIFVTSLILVGLSGFRSMVIGIVAAMVISGLIRGGARQVVPLFAIGLPALVLLVLSQGTLINLPLPMQRALSFLPGRWDPVAVSEAEGSTAWRVEMWKIMLTEEKYIESKWFGDGFGFSSRQLEIMAAKRVLGDLGDQEHFMTVGAVHSGPISAIRYVGYVGLAIFLAFTGLLARRAWLIAVRAKGTIYFPLALFVCIPTIWEPFNYVFIFGGFEAALPKALMTLGMLKMLENTLDRLGDGSAALRPGRKRDSRRSEYTPKPGALVPAI